MLDSIALEQIDRDNPLTIGAEYRSGRKVQSVDVQASSAAVLRTADGVCVVVRGWIDSDLAGCTLPTRRHGEGYLAMTPAQARSLRDAITAALECQPDTSGASHDPRADYDEPAALGRHPLA